MGDRTGISWTGSTWNPVTGCSRVSDGCRHCYAEELSLRFGWSRKPWTAANAAENVVLHYDRLDQPLRWTKPRRVFVNSMSDLFHEQIPTAFLVDVFHTMERASAHTFQVLTKRPERMREFMRVWCATEAAPPNVWLGVSIEQDRWAGRADVLRDTPAAVRFISAEPLLEGLPSLNLAGIDWLIVGGESGPHHRPFDPQWARDLRAAAAASGAAYFFKQHGGRTPTSGGDLLDGRQWHEYPEGEGLVHA